MAQEVNQALAREFGLSADEYQRVLDIMGRTPSLTELGVFSVMWSEHCSYKSSRIWLKQLPTTAPWVIHGPGENAGVIDIGEGMAAIFKMESHNHPSFIEPYQGAATGVGGILRDVFTMGARPIANLNALRFGSVENARTKRIVDGVVRGIGGYGNCVGVPTVGGEINFHAAYDGNPLVNAMTVGIARTDKIFLSAAAGIGNPVVYVGSKTGRDGIHGATMASAEFGADSEEKRPTVQVGDPFTEKLLIEACLELMATDAIVAIQDMGAAGLTSSSVEMAGKGGVGIVLDLDSVPQRETGMTAYEMMLSESQERMLIVLRPDREDLARKIFEKWELDFAVIGHLTDSGRIVVRHQGRVEADIPLAPLADQAPLYERPTVETPKQPVLEATKIENRWTLAGALEKLISGPDLCSRAWVWDQYDSTVGGQTVQRPGAADAAVVKIEGSRRALAITTDCTPRYCLADPKSGGMQAVAEAWRNLTAVGARPLAITDNMNFGNPEKPEIMGQFVQCIEGMREACLKLDFPVVSGNVSLYNETNGKAILPTPAIGAIGLVDDLSRTASLAFKTPGEEIVVIGATFGHLGASQFLKTVAGREDGAPPAVDLAAERRNGDFVRGLIISGQLGTVHDISDGGLLVALAEMALAGNLGAEILPPEAVVGRAVPLHAWLFGEDQGRYIVTTKDAGALLAAAKSAGVPAWRIGMTVAAATLTIAGAGTISLAELRQAHEGWLPGYMAAGA